MTFPRSHSQPDPGDRHRTIHLKLPAPFKILAMVVLLMFMIPLAMYLFWLLAPVKPLTLMIVDKSSVNISGLDRASFYWILKHTKHTRPDGQYYSPATDFRGFVPIGDTAYALTGLEGYTPGHLDSLAASIDGAYYIDTYGVTRDAWRGKAAGRARTLYGGLSPEDVQLIRNLRSRGKPVLAEFNFFGSPTPDSVRHAAQRAIGVYWTGWIGRYFPSLDTLENPELPRWIVDAHQSQSGTGWNYRNPGVVLVRSDGTIVILEQGAFLTQAVPYIITRPDIADRIGTDAVVPYPFWFDITIPLAGNTTISHILLHTTARGDSLLRRFNLNRAFPAVIRNTHGPLVIYFCLDAADNPAPTDVLASFRGVRFLKYFFYDEKAVSDRRFFYWNYYLPVITDVLREIHENAGNQAPLH